MVTHPLSLPSQLVMLKSIPVRLLLVALVGPMAALSQTRLVPVDTTYTEPDQELDNFSGRYHQLHIFSAQLRGVRAAHQTVYWASPDGRHLSAYQAGKRQWVVDVVAPSKRRFQPPTSRQSS
jgi:hypothetical protein